MSEIEKRRKKRKNLKKDDDIEIITDEDETETNSNEKKNKLKKSEKIFIVLNIVIILLLIAYYGYRTVYYYKREHKKEEKITLKEKITEIGNITYKDDGLYVKDNNYYFKGSNVNNYVYYSGRMFRIISIEEDIKMIEDDNATNLIYSIDEKYDKSIIYKWLQKYLNTYKDRDMYLVQNKWCNNAVDINNYKCNENLNDYIGLLSTNEYLNAGGNNSFLNNNSYFWTINYDDNSFYFVNNNGSINNYIKDKSNNYFSYGIKPVITISGNVMYIKGNGTKNSPYIFTEDEPSLLKNTSVGHYISYNDRLFRVIDIDENGVSMIMDDSLELEKKYDEVIKYLNNDFIKEFNKDELVKHSMITNLYNYDNGYDFNEKIKEDEVYISIPKISDLYISNDSDCWLNTVSDKKVNTYYVTDDNNIFYGDLKNSLHKIKPIIKLNSDIIIKSGNGMKDNPFVVE